MVGRGKGPAGGQPVGSGRFIGKANDSWRTGQPQPFKHSWDYHRTEGSNRQERLHKDWEDYEDTGFRGSRVPRFAKMEFPTYDGKGDPVEWLQKCEDFFEEQQTPTDAWVRQATFSVQG